MLGFDRHYRDLEALLQGKDPRRLTSKTRGRALIVLEDDGELRRITIDVQKKNVELHRAGAVPADGEPFAVVRGTFADWVRFFNDAADESLTRLKLYGDVDVLVTIGELLTTERSFVDVRSGAR